MNKAGTILVTAAILGLSSPLVLADRVGGAPKANFRTNELTIPCVQVTDLSVATEGKYYDIVLTRRGSSYNYELSAVVLEDQTACERIADFARYEDDDLDDTDDNSGSDSDQHDDKDDKDKPDDDDVSTNRPKRQAALAQCEIRADRSKITVKAKGLSDGNYFAKATSGANSVQSLVKASAEGEIEFHFDSSSNDVLAGAEAIEAGFLENAGVLAELFLDGSTTALLSDRARCRIKR